MFDHLIRNHQSKERTPTMSADETNVVENPGQDACSSSWIPREVGDALLVPFALDKKIARVVAITEDGRCVVDVMISKYSQTLKVEDRPGEWSRLGYWVKQTRGWIFPEVRWEFHPSS